MTDDREDALEAFLARASPAAPADAADRVLRRLPAGVVEVALFRSELEHVARRALLVSVAVAMLALLALGAALHEAPMDAAFPLPPAAGAPTEFTEPRSVTDVAWLLVSAERDAARDGSPRFLERR